MYFYMSEWRKGTLNRMFLKEYHNCINAKQYQDLMSRWGVVARNKSVIICKSLKRPPPSRGE